MAKTPINATLAMVDFPLHTVRVVPRGDLIILEADENRCILLFTSRELARNFVKQAHQIRAEPRLEVDNVADKNALKGLLDFSLQTGLDAVMWNPHVDPPLYNLTSIAEVIDDLN